MCSTKDEIWECSQMWYYIDCKDVGSESQDDSDLGFFLTWEREPEHGSFQI